MVVPIYQRSSTMTTRARTLRLPIDQAEELEAIAGVDEVSVNEEIRRAIAAHIEARRQDADFRKRLQDSIDRNKEILERLAR
jgi:Mg-chelatase subunit ChlI